MQWFTTTKIGRSRRLTPEGFMVCEAVPIARTGVQVYGASELPELDAGRDMIIRVDREPEEVFRAETIASFQGKAITDDHPSGDVTPDNWRDLSLGSMVNVRRGDGGLSDFLLADFFITDPDLIKSLSDPDAELPEVSCGYDAEYEQTEPGRGRQHKIMGNHVALVDRGRCGPSCAIGDSDMTATTPKGLIALRDRIARAFSIKDRKALDAALSEEAIANASNEALNDTGSEAQPTGGGGGVTNHFHIGTGGTPEKDEAEPEDPLKKIMDAVAGLVTRMDAWEKRGTDDAEGEKKDDDDTKDAEGEDPDEKREKTGDSALTAADSATMRKVIQLVRAQAEILSPGVKLSVPTADAGAMRRTVTDSLCSCKRKALDVAYRTNADAKASIDAFLNGADPGDFSKMKARTVDTIFTGASEIMRAKNNANAGRGSVTTQDFGKRPPTPADLNKLNRERWNPSAGTGR